MVVPISFILNILRPSSAFSSMASPATWVPVIMDFLSYDKGPTLE
jgi:hypothetical protein